MSHKRLSCRQTAERTGLSEFTLARYRAQDRGPSFVRVSRNRVEYLEDAVEAWVNARTVRPSTEGAAA
ncbi:helix-turn-helix transcriptional regulator [Gemmatimonas sp.]|uniref:helix-turn-helix transcriptional regulator n=1 Tax=Gemmatimonas sp. TaxID=1962908 RepID=UPI003DA6794D